MLLISRIPRPFCALVLGVAAQAVLLASTASSFDFDPELLVYHESYDGEVSFPTTPEVDFIAGAGVITDDSPSETPFSPAVLTGFSALADVGNGGTDESDLLVIEFSGVPAESLGFRSYASGLNLAADGSVFLGTALQLAPYLNRGLASVSASVNISRDVAGNASGSVSVRLVTVFPPPVDFVVEFANAALSNAQVEAIAGGSSFLVELLFDLEAETAQGSVTVAGLPEETTPVLDLTPLMLSSSEEIFRVYQGLEADPLDLGDADVEFGAFSIYRVFPYATSFMVDSVSDAPDANLGDGLCLTSGAVCSLRAAIQESNAIAGPGEIHLPAGNYALSVSGAQEDQAATGDLDITDDLMLRGSGRATTIVDANGIDRVFDLPRPGGIGVRAYLLDLEITGGSASTILGSTGGGINSWGDLTVRRSIVSNNDANRAAGILNYGSLVLEDTVVRDNVVVDYGFGTPGIGGIATGALSGQGAAVGAHATISKSAIIDNVGVAAVGLDFSNAASSSVANSTVSGNQADQVVVVDSTVSVTQSTIVAEAGNAVDVRLLNGANAFNLASAVLQGAPACFFDFAFPSAPTIPISSASNDLSCGLTGVENVQGQSLGLGPLASIGNSFGHVPGMSSPLIDTASPVTCPIDDQVGTPRPLDGDLSGSAECDMGAIEVPEPAFGLLLMSGFVGLIIHARASAALPSCHRTQ